ncbi:MAG: GldG family protein [Culturomica sp.]|jgi:gliding-associated putative ABC transporter substrate-binding component GldG|nr:GldG family protein [Culturomica sp.]
MKSLFYNNIYIIILIIAINIISYFVFVRFDTTEKSEYSLSPVSKDVIKTISEPVKVDVYMSKDLPIQFRKINKEFIYILKEYKHQSIEPFEINLIEVENAEDRETAQSEGIIPVIIEAKEEDYAKIQKIYLGAVFKINNQQHTIGHIDANTPIEYEITRILKQVFDTVKPKVAFLTGHHEATFSAMPQLIGALEELVEISVLNPAELKSDDLVNYDVVCIIGAQDYYSNYELHLLNEYLSVGGRLFIALNHAIGQISVTHNSGFINETGLEDFLEEKGAKIQNNFVVDYSCGRITLSQYDNLLRFRYNQEINFPYFLKVVNFSKHEITDGLNYMLLPFASSIKQVRTSTTYVFNPLFKSTSISGTQRSPLFFNLQREWSRSDFNNPEQVLCVLLTNNDNKSAIIAVTNSRFLINNDIVLQQHIQQPDNIKFTVNSIEWLSDRSGLIKLRNKFTTFTTLRSIESGQRTFIEYLNFLLPLFLISIFGAFWFQYQRNRRMRRSNDGYIE